MIKQKIVKTMVKEIKGAKKLQVTIDDTTKISKEPADKPVKFAVLSTVLAMIYALPSKFLKKAESLSVLIEPKSFSISGTSKDYSFTLTSLTKDEPAQVNEMVIPVDFHYFCQLFGLTGGTNGIVKIKFEIK